MRQRRNRELGVKPEFRAKIFLKEKPEFQKFRNRKGEIDSKCGRGPFEKRGTQTKNMVKGRGLEQSAKFSLESAGEQQR